MWWTFLYELCWGLLPGMIIWFMFLFSSRLINDACFMYLFKIIIICWQHVYHNSVDIKCIILHTPCLTSLTGYALDSKAGAWSHQVQLTLPGHNCVFPSVRVILSVNLDSWMTDGFFFPYNRIYSILYIDSKHSLTKDIAYYTSYILTCFLVYKIIQGYC